MIMVKLLWKGLSYIFSFTGIIDLLAIFAKHSAAIAWRRRFALASCFAADAFTEIFALFVGAGGFIQQYSMNGGHLPQHYIC